ncbi:transcriptional repressor [Candidatus Woesearchaeota archaeon]|nr:transcriptional repressor [Candidatus Woesearchaeota archaeon]
MKNTYQRLKILEHLKSVKTHPTAEQVYNKIKPKISTISLATVHRNLNQMAESNQILKLEVKGQYHFDADLSLHQHFVCSECGKIYDLFQPDISEYALDEIDQNKFQVNNVQVIFNGICSKCKKI